MASAWGLDSTQSVKIFRSKESVIAFRALHRFVSQIDYEMTKSAADLNPLFLGILALVGKFQPSHRAIDPPRIPEIFDQSPADAVLASNLVYCARNSPPLTGKLKSRRANSAS